MVFKKGSYKDDDNKMVFRRCFLFYRGKRVVFGLEFIVFFEKCLKGFVVVGLN